jgi:hypothetical protein
MASLPLLRANAKHSDAALHHALESPRLNSPIASETLRAARFTRPTAFLPRSRTMSSVPSTRCLRSSGKNRSKPPESGPKNRW